MTPENFVYWLQGYFELLDKENTTLTEKQTYIIKEHLALVLNKETKSMLEFCTVPNTSLSCSLGNEPKRYCHNAQTTANDTYKKFIL